MVGQPTVHVRLGDATTASRCVVKLTDVDDIDRSTLISVGAVDLRSAQVDPRNGPARVAITLSPIAHRVAAGHRLRLVISDSDFPRLWPAEQAARICVYTADGDRNVDQRVAEAVTAVSLPLCRMHGQDDVVLPSLPPNTDREKDKFASRPTWTTCRDHNRRSLTTTLGATQNRLHTADGETILEREFTASAIVHAPDPAEATMTASGRFVIDTHDGDRVVIRTDIEIGTNAGLLSGVVSVNDRPIVDRQWPLSR